MTESDSGTPITAGQRRYGRLAATMVLLNFLLQGLGDFVTIIARGGQPFADTARVAAGSPVLWRVSLLEVGAAWIAIGIFAFGLYAVLALVDRRLAQLALVLRLGASFVGASSLMFRVAQLRSWPTWRWRCCCCAD